VSDQVERAEVIRRLGLGLDVPPELLESGAIESTHWSALREAVWGKPYPEDEEAYVKRCPDCGAVAGPLDPIMHGSQCGWDDEIRQDRGRDEY